jgi:molybdenum cofactor cytidylyltransferase
MGQPKQLLPWGNGTLLRQACANALRTSCRPVIVVLGCEAEACRHACAGLDLVTVVNEHWANGLGSSLAMGVEALETAVPDITGALVLLMDQPTVTPTLLETLVARWAPPTWPIAATTYGTEAGVPAVFHRCYFPELKALRLDQGARPLIAREKARTVRVDPGGELVDLDTPESYQRTIARKDFKTELQA